MKKIYKNINKLEKLSDVDSSKRIQEAKKRVLKGVYSSDFILDDLVDRFTDAISLDWYFDPN